VGNASTSIRHSQAKFRCCRNELEFGEIPSSTDASHDLAKPMRGSGAVPGQQGKTMEHGQLLLTVRDKVAQEIAHRIFTYQNAKTAQVERDMLLELRAVSATLMLTDPLTGLGSSHETKVLDVSPNELNELLAAYRANHGGPDEKKYLAKIQNCALRMQVSAPWEDERKFLDMLSDLQKKEKTILILM
jgi:hypothetical protein